MFQKITGFGHHKVLLICTYLRGMYRVYAIFPWSGYVRPRNTIKHRHNHDYEVQECFVVLVILVWWWSCEKNEKDGLLVK